MPAGVPALSLDVVADEPVNVGVETDPAGVIVSAPPVPPTFILAASVPMIVMPFKSAASVQPAEQEPDVISNKEPEGTPPPAVPIRSHDPVPQSYRSPVLESTPSIVKLHGPVGAPANRRISVLPACARRQVEAITNSKRIFNE